MNEPKSIARPNIHFHGLDVETPVTCVEVEPGFVALRRPDGSDAMVISRAYYDELMASQEQRAPPQELDLLLPVQNRHARRRAKAMK